MVEDVCSDNTGHLSLDRGDLTGAIVLTSSSIDVTLKGFRGFTWHFNWGGFDGRNK